jgi:hypothetical protein
LLCAALAGCGGPLRFALKGTPIAPGSDAAVVAKVDEKSAMTHLNITVEHLAPPDRLQSGGTAFVVWARKDDNATWSRVGAINYDADARKGGLSEASVPLMAFDLIISIEEQVAPASPSPHVVFTQRVQD